MVKRCPICKKNFITEEGCQKYCSRKCGRKAVRNREYPKMIKICEICGEKFKASGRQVTCSPSCSRERQGKRSQFFNEKYKKEGKLHSTWLKLRFSILRRDNFTCQYCGRTPQNGVKLQIDHIIPESKGGKFVEENLITSCEECNLGKRDVILAKREIEKIKKRRFEK